MSRKDFKIFRKITKIIGWKVTNIAWKTKLLLWINCVIFSLKCLTSYSKFKIEWYFTRYWEVSQAGKKLNTNINTVVLLDRHAINLFRSENSPSSCMGQWVREISRVTRACKEKGEMIFKNVLESVLALMKHPLCRLIWTMVQTKILKSREKFSTKSEICKNCIL